MMYISTIVVICILQTIKTCAHSHFKTASCQIVLDPLGYEYLPTHGLCLKLENRSAGLETQVIKPNLLLPNPIVAVLDKFCHRLPVVYIVS